MTFGQKIKMLRLCANLTQRQLAQQIGTSHSAIALYESDRRKPSFAQLCIIAHYFQVPVSSLADDAEDMPVQPTAEEMLPLDERRLLNAYREADPIYKAIVIELLESHRAP